MKLSDVLAATFALSRQERHVLFQTIAVAENWGIAVEGEWINAKKAEAAQEPTALEPANNRKAYTTEELVALHEIASRMDAYLPFGKKQRREAITEAAKRFGRTYKAIAEKIRTIRAE